MAHIAHITDLHFWEVVRNPLLLLNKRFLGTLNLLLRRRRYVRLERAPSAADLLRGLDLDALLVGGDLTTTATAGEYKMAAAFLDTLAASGIRIILTPGNHDMYTFEAVRSCRFNRHLGAYAPCPEVPGLSQLPDGTQVLCLPTSQANVLSSRGYITGLQLEQTEALLAETTESPLIVLAHYPVLTHTDRYHLSLSRRLGNAHGLRALLGHSKKRMLYLAGHVHVFSHTRDPEFPNIEQVTTGAMFYERSRAPGGFCEIETTDTGFTVYPWLFQGGWQRQAATRPQGS